MSKFQHRSFVYVSGVFLLMTAALLGVGTVYAQRPGGGGGRPTPSGSGGDTLRPTREVPAFATPAATFAIPADGGNLPTPQGNFTLPSTIPTLQIPVGSSEAEVAVINFAGIYLGIQPDLLYAGDLTASLNAAGGKASAAGATTLEATLNQLPVELQSFLDTAESMSGAMYWGVWQTGTGVVAVGDCTDNPNCTVSMDNLNLYLTQSSGGLYTTYAKTVPASAADALNLIVATYPALSGLAFEPSTYTDTGYAFQSEVVNLGSSSTIEVVYAGVINSSGQSLVYVWVAVGEGYVGVGQK